MIKAFVPYSLLLPGMLFFAQRTQAQLLRPVLATGQVTDRERHLVLYPASVRNISAGLGVYTDKGGYFRIGASRRDTIVITFLGYHPDTMIVNQASGEAHAAVRGTTGDEQPRSRYLDDRTVPRLG
ncbi:carboxypeptidase-like regulatory domain-containing protein [Chitinophaga horti]|uniref:Carboxypeptidase-like regulatory domain-containing protein n=1 Tax=Chitinophaga horti TaxID=2920382 RepID=A0ABY6J708_9BACT|nr:carboxypeptidase-like regulatory domain-containing protein [Chitinophaga horti]UYQ93939.1 carboxypeptidase-like regulatory domain-containing protein [Chitinophaga horti]